MKRIIIQTREFSNVFDKLEAQRKILVKDYEDFERALLNNPEIGDLMEGTGGLRKTRLKSSSKGKRSGFRVCYCDIPEKEKIYLIAIFAKNEKENLTKAEKNLMKDLIDFLKKE